MGFLTYYTQMTTRKSYLQTYSFFPKATINNQHCSCDYELNYLDAELLDEWWIEIPTFHSGPRSTPIWKRGGFLRNMDFLCCYTGEPCRAENEPSPSSLQWSQPRHKHLWLNTAPLNDIRYPYKNNTTIQQGCWAHDWKVLGWNPGLPTLSKMLQLND